MWEVMGNDTEVKEGIKVLESVRSNVDKSEAGRITGRQISIMTVFYVT
jgi:hypothetical protein